MSAHHPGQEGGARVVRGVQVAPAVLDVLQVRGQAADLLRRLVQRSGERGRAQGVALGAPGLGDVVDDDVEAAASVGSTYESVLDSSVAPLLDPAQPVQEGEGAAADGGGAGSVCHALILRPSCPDEGRMRGLADGAGARGGAAPVDTRRGAALPLSLILITKREESEH